MTDFIELLLSNTLYLIVTVCLLAVVVFFGAKKMTKLFIYAALILVAFLAYVYYTGESVESAVKPVQKVIE